MQSIVAMISTISMLPISKCSVGDTASSIIITSAKSKTDDGYICVLHQEWNDSQQSATARNFFEELYPIIGSTWPRGNLTAQVKDKSMWSLNVNKDINTMLWRPCMWTCEVCRCGYLSFFVYLIELVSDVRFCDGNSTDIFQQTNHTVS